MLPALAFHAFLIVASALQFGRIPLIGMHDTLGFLAFAIGVVYVIAAWNRERDLFSYLTTPLICSSSPGLRSRRP